MATGRLTEIIKARRESGSGIASSLAGGVKERLKEKLDPRRIFNQTGLLTSLFPKLRAYKSQLPGVESQASALTPQQSNSDTLAQTKPLFQSISVNTKIIAKNSMVLPMIQKDTNLMKQTLKKIVKAMQVKKKVSPVPRVRPTPIKVVPELKSVETEKEEPEKGKGVIDILKDLVASIATMTALVGKGLKEGLSGLSDKIIKGVVSGLKGLFNIGKLGASMIGRFMLPILGFMASPAGLAILLGSAFFAVLYRGFTAEERDAEKRKEYGELKQKFESGTATQAEKRRMKELESYGYAKEDIEIPDKIVNPATGLKQSGRTSVGAFGTLREILKQKPGTEEYLSDEELIKGEFGKSRADLQKWMDEYLKWEKSGKKGQLQNLNEPATTPSRIPSGEMPSSPISNFMDSMVSSPFGTRQFQGQTEKHGGVDIAGKMGDPIYAPEGGTARVKSDPKGYGNYIEILDDKGQVAHLLAHLSEVTVKDGQRIEKGEQIGKMGSTGKSTGPHLHWEKFDESGQRIDPIAWAKTQKEPQLLAPRPQETVVPATQYAQATDQNDLDVGSSMQQIIDTSQNSRIGPVTRIEPSLNLNHPLLASLSLQTFITSTS